MARKNSLTNSIREMRVGQIIEFPIERCTSVQSVASVTGLRYDRHYTTETFREKRVIKVKLEKPH